MGLIRLGQYESFTEIKRKTLLISQKILGRVVVLRPPSDKGTVQEAKSKLGKNIVIVIVPTKIVKISKVINLYWNHFISAFFEMFYPYYKTSMMHTNTSSTVEKARSEFKNTQQETLCLASLQILNAKLPSWQHMYTKNNSRNSNTILECQS